ncbi:hypothetical protein ABI59_12240 [Acidobacteria bacterium Mor1]|nr:hypothetical protein ABI59_12240 [Acidobacteria bacterium Mor1]
MAHVTFIHGICNKPEPEELHNMWLRALREDEGIDLHNRSIDTRMVYWADVMYAEPDDDEGGPERVGSDVATQELDDRDAWKDSLSEEQQRFVQGLTGKLGYEEPSPEGDEYAPEPSDQPGFERIPLPWFIKRRLMKALLRDVHHYLFNVEHSPRPGETYQVQTEIRRRFVEAIKEGAARSGNGPHVVVSHSMGTVIAYDCLKRVPECPAVDGLMTIGSPLGIDEIQDKLKPEYSRQDGFPAGRVTHSWVNIADRLDPVSLDTRLQNDYLRNGTRVVIDQLQVNGGKWRHDIAKYLSKGELRTHLARQLGISWP